MAKAKAAWGIEIGHAEVKAVRLERDGSDVRIADFIVIPHPKVLTTPDLNVEEMLRISLGALMSQKSFEGAAVVVSVPGNEGFARFSTLPPLPDKAIAQTVLFEAKQQIPFPLEEVEWDSHLFRGEDSPEVEVGIFAILKEKVAQRLGLYKELGLRPNALTLGPLAVYNAAVYDQDLDAPGKPVVAFLDIGTRATDLIVIRGGRCWIRTFAIGGHHFTEAIVAGVPQLSYGKGDQLKQQSATHAHAKKLMHIMRPVFDDLLRELQRSTSHYASLNPDQPITQIIGLGSTFRIPGLRSYLKDQLGIPIVRLESFQKIRVEGSAESEFSQHSMKFATAAGLALQGLGLGSVNVNLSPVGNLREQVWMRKSKWFVAAAVLMCLASAAMFIPLGGSVSGEFPVAVRAALADGKKQVAEFEEAKTAADVGSQANNFIFLLDDREVWPWIVADVNAAIASAGAQEQLLRPFDPAKPPVPVEEWNTVELSELSGAYELTAGATPKRSFEVTMRLMVPRDLRGAKEFVQKSVLEWLNKNADRPAAPYVIQVPKAGFVPEFAELDEKGRIDGASGAGAAGGAAGGPAAGGSASSGESGASGRGGMQAMGRNRGEAGSIQTGKQRPGSLGGGSNPFGTGGGDAPAGAKPRDRKAARAAVQSTAAEPVKMDADAPIPARPDPLAGKPVTAVSVKFTVLLRDPVGRSVAAPAAAGEGAAQ
jgi:type IV pilus assembly protein PilM